MKVYNLHKTNSVKIEKLYSLIYCIKQRFDDIIELKLYKKSFQKDIKDSLLPEDLVDLCRNAISNKVSRRFDKICEEAFFKEENKKRKLESDNFMIAYNSNKTNINQSYQNFSDSIQNPFILYQPVRDLSKYIIISLEYNIYNKVFVDIADNLFPNDIPFISSDKIKNILHLIYLLIIATKLTEPTDNLIIFQQIYLQ
jgi:hypothetical protein